MAMAFLRSAEIPEIRVTLTHCNLILRVVMPQMDPNYFQRFQRIMYSCFNGAYTISWPQEKFKKFVYPRANQFSNIVQMAERGVLLRPLTASNTIVTPLRSDINLEGLL